MWSFLLDLFRDPAESFTVIVVDTEGLNAPRQYIVEPQKFLQIVIGIVATTFVVILLLIPPINRFIFGGQSEEITVQSNNNRLAALQDSLETQQMYLLKLRQAILGSDSTGHIPAFTRTPQPIENTPTAEANPPTSPTPSPVAKPETNEQEFKELVAEASQAAQNWKDHTQPALSMDNLNVKTSPPVQSYLSGLRFPVMAPIRGFVTRHFDPRLGHYGIDVATDAGANVRCIGDGYVIFSDWTRSTGFVIVVQHKGGYVSIYRHNKQLMKRVGEKVRAQENIALAGNSGEISTGPHLHFELWHEGLAQDPKSLIMGW